MSTPSREARHQRREYLEYLEKQRTQSEEIATNNNVTLEKQIKNIPLHDKNKLKREKQVIHKWQARQNEWTKIEQDLASRVRDGNSDELMMTTTDNFRAKCELYDMHQMTISNDEKHPSSTWLRSLRGSGSRFVSVGSEFSGLYSEIEKEPVYAVPKIIRKPRTQHPQITSKLSGTSSFRNEAGLLTLRQFEPEQSDINHLEIKSRNLFDWAIESTAKYFSMIDNKEAEAAAVFDESNDLVYERVPRASFSGPLEQHFSALPQQATHRTNTFVNHSSVSLLYRLTPLPDEGGSHHSRFFGDPSSGEVKPGESVDLVFTFLLGESPSDEPHRQVWKLETTPIVEVSVFQSPSAQKTPIYLQLVGHPLKQMSPIPTTPHTVAPLSQANFSNWVTEVVYAFVDRVCTPLTPAIVLARKQQAFLARNHTILQELVSITGFEVSPEFSICFSMKRLNDWTDFYFSSLRTISSLVEQLRALSSHHSLLASSVERDGPQEAQTVLGDISHQYDYSLKDNEAAINALQLELFPERTLVSQYFTLILFLFVINAIIFIAYLGHIRRGGGGRRTYGLGLQLGHLSWSA